MDKYDAASTFSNLQPRVFLITGATGAIGKAIARLLANNKDSEVVLVGRNLAIGVRTAQEIIEATGNRAVRFELVDVSRREQIRSLAKCWQGPLHVLINNAASAPRNHEQTPAGIEMQFATNVLSYFWFIDAFTEILKVSAPARIINIASYWSGGLDLNDPEFIHRRYDNDLAYRQSKQANRMLTVAFAGKLATYQISVNSCHPGDVNSKLSKQLGFGGHESPEQGAETPVWLATDPVGLQQTGRYFEHKRETRCAFGQDSQAVAALFDLCASYSTR